MKIKELKAGQGKVDVEGVIKSMGEVRIINKYGKDLKLCNAVVGDDSGEISLTLWNDDTDKVKQGNKVKITNGYVSEFNGKLQLTSGKFGKLEVVDAEAEAAM
ncbi:DNA-binding protein [Candidatus Pacearchaeota archaeon]|nr:DNA-binding protein [Candidatus Pacearchaeota archaeon]